MRIRNAIFIVYVAASAVGFLFLLRYVLAEVRPRYVAAVRGNLHDSARILAAALRDRSAAEAKSALGGGASFRVRLLAADGRVLFDTAEKTPAEREYPSSPGRELARRAGTSLIDGNETGAELEVTAVEPLSLADEPKARLELSRSFRSVNAVIWAERRKLATVAFLIAGVMLVAGWWIAAPLTRSLERLTVYVQGVRDGLPVKPPASRAREIATLGAAFEEMRDVVAGRKHAERYTQALAHEVKAPLAAIRGAAELLGEEMPPEQRARFLGNIRSESARIQQIVDRLLELSSLEARKTIQQIETILMGDLMAEAADVVRPAYHSARITLAISGTTAAVRGERVLLREALVNLLQNALDFSPAGSEVTLIAAIAGGRLVVSVEDGGQGVPDYALPRVFERFYSLPRPGTTRKSTGLGLALVREIAHLHGGDASLDNRTGGVGATATIWLPLAPTAG